MIWSVDLRRQVGALELEVAIEGPAGPLALVGPNGSGKTTLLRAITGALRPERGTITVAGRTLFSSERGIDLAIEARRIGYVPQGYGLFPHLSVLDNVAFGLSTGAARKPREERRHLAGRMLEELECTHLSERKPARLSGGEQQRVALARALVLEPDLLLLDEPLAALDASARRSVRAFLSSRLRTLGTPSVVVTHDLRDVAALDAPVCVLERGRIVQTGSIAALCSDPATDFVAELAPLGSLSG
jgi:ABC-type sulfate/molybdate transport systems ATPase subunit